MSYLSPPPPELKQVEYTQLYFHLEFSEYFDLPPMGLLHLRRELLLAVRTLQEWGDPDAAGELNTLLQPPIPDDPLMRRQVQKPAPAFVLAPDAQLQGLINPKQRIVLPVLFLGNGLKTIDAFVRLFVQLGKQGLFNGVGHFRLEAVEAEDASGVRSMLWMAGGQLKSITPPVSDLLWWLERQKPATDRLELEFLSPLRLVKNRKPLFKADFADIFPFLLRRVSAMLACHAAIEVINDPIRLLELANKTQVIENRLRWRDYRCLAAETNKQDLGGLLEVLSVAGPELDELLWILRLGSLFNIGKGATYGAGQYRLRTYC